MVKLLIIADDFTGALDTGVQFAVNGADTKVITTVCNITDLFKEDADVLVVNTESRHLSADQAYKIVYEVTRQAVLSEVSYIYKKTDSALRGNIGSELAAVMDGAGVKILPFVPAFPEMKRITINGIHYIDQIPVHMSVFGNDPFEPVRVSYIPDLIAAQTEKVVRVVQQEQSEQDLDGGIYVYDAETIDQVRAVGERLKEKGKLYLAAGCAGFAAVLSDLLEFRGSQKKMPLFSNRLLVGCGSVNKITRNQLDYAEQGGFTRIVLSQRQKLEPDYFNSDEGKSFLKELEQICKRETRILIDSNDVEEGEAKLFAEQNGISMDEMRVRISERVGYLIKYLIEHDLNSMLLVTGGDTLMGFMNQIGCYEIAPICELAPGVVLSEFLLENETYPIISKSGGFGDQDLIVKISELLNLQEGVG